MKECYIEVNGPVLKELMIFVQTQQMTQARGMFKAINEQVIVTESQ